MLQVHCAYRGHYILHSAIFGLSALILQKLKNFPQWNKKRRVHAVCTTFRWQIHNAMQHIFKMRRLPPCDFDLSCNDIPKYLLR